MLKIELVPTLSQCVETVAKREYEGTLKRLLTGEEVNNELEEKAEILRLFLQTADFKKLRAESEMWLVEGKTVKFMIYVEYRVPRYAMQVLSDSQD